MPEPLPIKEFLDELDSQWNSSNVTEPQIIEVTGATNDPLRFNLNVNDVVFGRAGDPAMEETPIGNWTYGNRIYNLGLELYTNNSSRKILKFDSFINDLSDVLKQDNNLFDRQRFIQACE